MILIMLFKQSAMVNLAVKCTLSQGTSGEQTGAKTGISKYYWMILLLAFVVFTRLRYLLMLTPQISASLRTVMLFMFEIYQPHQ